VKIACVIDGTDSSAPMAERFGRAANFLIFDSEQGNWELISNTVNLAAVQGAGIQTAEAICRSGAEILITARCGPKAYRVLSEGGVAIYTAPADASCAGNAVIAYLDGQLSQLDGPDVKGHWL
jgi:predicted Fe-Mo cluster-binding NifX family protein